MKCTECGTKCVKIDVDSTATTTSYQCPECCNTFAKPVRPVGVPRAGTKAYAKAVARLSCALAPFRSGGAS